jgi:hypothetical protein
MTTFYEKVTEKVWPATRAMLISISSLSGDVGGGEGPTKLIVSQSATPVVESVANGPTGTLGDGIATITYPTMVPALCRAVRSWGTCGLFYGVTGYVAAELTVQLWCGMQAAITPIGTPAPEPISIANMIHTYLFGNLARLIRGSSGLVTLHRMLCLMEDGDEQGAEELQARSNNNATRSMYRATKWALALNGVYPRLGRVRSAAEDMVIAIHINKLFINGYEDVDLAGEVVRGSGPVRLIDRYKLQAKVVEIYWQMGRDLSAEELRDGRVDFDMSGRPISGALTAMWDYYIRGIVPSRQV